MSERDKIELRLRKKAQEIQSLEDKLRTARIYYQALSDVMKLLEDDGEQQEGDTVLRSGSTVARARSEIIKAGRPVHINDLLEAIGKELTRENRASLTSSLAAYVRRGDIFTRPAPNTFGLIELGHESEDVVSNEPPRGFGTAKPEGGVAPQSSDELDDEIPF